MQSPKLTDFQNGDQLEPGDDFLINPHPFIRIPHQ